VTSDVTAQNQDAVLSSDRNEYSLSLHQTDKLRAEQARGNSQSCSHERKIRYNGLIASFVFTIKSPRGETCPLADLLITPSRTWKTQSA